MITEKNTTFRFDISRNDLKPLFSILDFQFANFCSATRDLYIYYVEP